MYVSRQIENTILECLQEFPVVLLSGPRQVGKTTTLENICHQYHYCTLDDPILLNQALEEPSLFLLNNTPPVFIDEVQYAPELFRYIKMRVDSSHQMGAFLLTGSQTFELLENASETLAGRMAIVEMQGFSLREQYGISFNLPFYPTKKYIEERKKVIKPYHDVWNRIQRGSLPYLTHENVHWERYYGSYVKTYIERDVRKSIHIKDEMKFLKFLIATAARCGELLNYNSIANEIDSNIDTVKRWISLLQSSGIIFLLEPYANNIMKRVVKSPKLYFYDTGLVCYLTRWTSPDVLKNGAKAGNIFENFIVSEIMKSHINSGKMISSLYYYRDKDQKEIDLILEENDILYPIEIKMSANPTLSMAKAFNALDSIPNKKRGLGCILCLYDKAIYLAENVIVLPIDYI